MDGDQSGEFQWRIQGGGGGGGGGGVPGKPPPPPPSLFLDQTEAQKEKKKF